METKPANITVYLLPSDNLYFDPLDRVLYHLKIGDLKDCGWFLRRWKIYNAARKNTKYLEEFQLEYYGRFRCPLAKYYRGWTIDVDDCPMNLCEAMRQNR